MLDVRPIYRPLGRSPRSTLSRFCLGSTMQECWYVATVTHGLASDTSPTRPVIGRSLLPGEETGSDVK